MPIRFEYAWAFYATLAAAVIAMPFALRFGGSLTDLPMPKGASHGETLH